jgi:sugar phosphate isomerase/epimerase
VRKRPPEWWGFRERVEAAAQTGWDSISIFYPYYLRAQESEGLSDADMCRILEDNAIRVDQMEACHDWTYDGVPARTLGQEGLRTTCACGLCMSASRIVELGDMFGARTLIATQRTDALPVEVAGARLAKFCDLAAEHGQRVAIEFLPYSPIQNVMQAISIIEASGRDNAGLCFDTLHHLSMSGDDSWLARVPAERVFMIQVNDGLRRPRGASREELWKQMQNANSPGYAPGEDELNVLGTLTTLERMGVYAPTGPEARKPQWKARSARYVAAELRERMDRLLEAAASAATP